MEMANDTPVFKNVQDKIQLLIFLLDYWRFNFKLNYKYQNGFQIFFFTYVRRNMQIKSGIGPLTDERNLCQQ